MLCSLCRRTHIHNLSDSHHTSLCPYLLETLFESLSQSWRNISQVKMALTKTSRHWYHLFRICNTLLCSRFSHFCIGSAFWQKNPFQHHHLPALIVARMRRGETRETEVLVKVKLLPPPLSQHGLHLPGRRHIDENNPVVLIHLWLPSLESFCQKVLRGGGKKRMSRIF